MTFEELLKDEKVLGEIIEKVNNEEEFIDEIKKYGVETSIEEIQSFLEKVPLSEDELEQVNGGAYGIGIIPFPKTSKQKKKLLLLFSTLKQNTDDKKL